MKGVHILYLHLPKTAANKSEITILGTSASSVAIPFRTHGSTTAGHAVMQDCL
jgi:hypothetical protein